MSTLGGRPLAVLGGHGTLKHNFVTRERDCALYKLQASILHEESES